MFSRLALSATACLTLVVSEPVIGQDTVQPASALDAALAAPTRTAANVARDKYRNPKETLTFFGVKPADTIVELWPGGGWYTEVLAPYLASGGALHIVPPAGRYDERIREKIASSPVYGKVQVATFTAGQPTGIAASSADVVLTFRNVHSWLDEDQPIADQEVTCARSRSSCAPACVSSSSAAIRRCSRRRLATTTRGRATRSGGS